ncbi:MAG: DinB family protein [Bacteroidota bacterium]
MKILQTIVLVYCAGTAVFTQDFNHSEWQTKWDNSKEYLMELVDMADTLDLNYKPTADQMSLRGQLTHIAGNMYFLSNRFLEYNPQGFDRDATLDLLNSDSLDLTAIKTELDKAFAFAKDAISNVADGDWSTEVQFFVGPRTKRVIAWLLQDHLTHHRGQLIVYLRLLGLKELPRYRGW